MSQPRHKKTESLLAENQVHEWGFHRTFVWADKANFHQKSRTHEKHTMRLVLNGEMTVSFPDEPDVPARKYGAGERVDIEAGRTHEVRMGKEGCTYVFGSK